MPYAQPRANTTYREAHMDEFNSREAGLAVQAYMARLGLSRTDVMKRGKIDLKTMRSLLNGTRKPTYRTIHKLEQALGWEPGTYVNYGNVEPPDQGPSLRGATDAQILVELARRISVADQLADKMMLESRAEATRGEAAKWHEEAERREARGE